jgi:predicted negative regulator of RcsB-dependent stress response
MELREIALLVGGLTLGFGLGLMVYAVHRIRETRATRYLRKAQHRYDKILGKVDAQQARMQESVDKLTALKEDYRVS